jgi:predicted CXXCH cytochrome family protein
MIGHRKDLLSRLALVFVVPALVLLSGCEEDEGPTGPLQEAAQVALAYVGYSAAAPMTPVCAECHGGIASGWAGTAHAGALTTLYNSGHQASFCLPCHTTGWNDADGIFGADDAWTAATADTLRLRDVQCEQCHGPASQHNTFAADPTDVLNPDDEELWDAELCGQCHEGAHHPTFPEWEQSGHAFSNQAAGGFVARNEPCMKCHVAQNFVRFLETGDMGSPVEDPAPLTCQACHSPHSKDHEGQLRLPLQGDVICGRCHTTDGVLPGERLHNSTWEVFTGTLDFTYPGETYANSAHTTTFTLRSCASGHVRFASYVSDTEPAETGHTFEVEVDTCQGCHAGATDFDVYGVQTATMGLIATLQGEIDAAEAAGSDTTASFNNAQYVLDAALREGSFGVHNTRYIQKLIQDAIDDLTP